MIRLFCSSYSPSGTNPDAYPSTNMSAREKYCNLSTDNSVKNRNPIQRIKAVRHCRFEGKAETSRSQWQEHNADGNTESRH